MGDAAGSMDLDELLKKHKRPEPEGQGNGADAPPRKKQQVGELAGAAEDGLQEVEGALRARDMQTAISILLKMACMRAQVLRDLAASEWVCLIIPTACFMVAAGRHAGKQYAEAASIAAAKPMLGPPHLYIAHGILALFFEKFVLISAAAELGLVIRHFRLKICYNDDYTRLQFSFAGEVTVPLSGVAQGMPTENTISKLELEQAMVKMAQPEDAKLKLGTAPMGHLEAMAQRLIDKSKTAGRGKGKG
ncbi:unnamed protein product, partial [Prorocentrum cordatum]